mgnify:CR=1 FL=1
MRVAWAAPAAPPCAAAPLPSLRQSFSPANQPGGPRWCGHQVSGGTASRGPVWQGRRRRRQRRLHRLGTMRPEVVGAMCPQVLHNLPPPAAAEDEDADFEARIAALKKAKGDTPYGGCLAAVGQAGLAPLLLARRSAAPAAARTPHPSLPPCLFATPQARARRRPRRLRPRRRRRPPRSGATTSPGRTSSLRAVSAARLFWPSCVPWGLCLAGRCSLRGHWQRASCVNAPFRWPACSSAATLNRACRGSPALCSRLHRFHASSLAAPLTQHRAGAALACCLLTSLCPHALRFFCCSPPPRGPGGERGSGHHAAVAAAVHRL